MPIGTSGGRSAGHPTGEGARRRNTPRERQLIDPPFDRESDTSFRFLGRYSWEDVIAASSWVIFCVVIGLVLGKWWGLT